MANEVLAALAVKIHGDTRHLDASLQTSGKRVLEFGKQAENSSRVFERAFAQNERSVDRLRRAIDPVYAASKKYESAVNTLDKALKQGNITQATHARLIEQANAAYLRAGTGATKAAGGLAALGNMSNQSKARIQNLGFQLQDVAIQLQAGTRASVVFAQQGSQIASIFGPVGAIIGTLAAVGIPLLAVAFANSAEEGQKLEDVMSDLRDLSQGLKDAQAILAMSVEELSEKYGRYALAVQEAARQLAFLQAAEARARLAESLQDMNDALRDFVQTENTAFRSGTMLTTAIANLSRELGISRPQARELSEALRDVRDAGSFDEMVAALQVVGTLLEEAGVSGDKIPPPLRQALIDVNNLTIGLAEMTAQADEAAEAVQSISLGSSGPPRRGGKRGPKSSEGDGFSGASSSGGAAPANPLIAQLDALRQALLTQEEAQIASYQRQQETLQQALEQRLITQQEYQALMEDAQRQHSERMAQIDAYRYGDGLQKAGAFFGDMASAFQSGNEKMAAIGKKFAAIEALINAWRAYNQTLADPSLPFFAKFAAAASVLAAGMNAVQAIKGSGGGAAGGAGGVSAAANTPAAPSNSAYFNVSLTGGNNYGGEQIRDLFALINQAIEDGAVIRGIRIA